MTAFLIRSFRFGLLRFSHKLICVTSDHRSPFWGADPQAPPWASPWWWV